MNREKGLQQREDSSPIRVLLIEDDPEDAGLLRDMLAEAKGTRFNVKWADRLQAGLEHLAEGEIDVLLLDLSLPDSVGLDTVLTVVSRASGVPIVVLTGLDDEALAMKAVRKGAQDYLVKGQVDSNLLVRSMRYAIERKRAEEALRLSQRELTIRNRIAEIFLIAPDEEMYGEVLQVIQDAMESKYGVFGFIDEDGNLVCPSMTRDIWDQCQMPNKEIVFLRETWRGIWGRALIEKKTLYSNEPFPVPKGHIQIVRALDVPILHQGKLIGNLLVGNKATDYDERDKKLLEGIAGYIAPILDARLRRDIEEKTRKRVEEGLKESEEKFRTLAEQSPNMIFINKKGQVVYANKKCEKIIGYRRKEFYAPHFDFFCLMAPESIEMVKASFARHMKGEEVKPYEYTLVTKDGKRIDALLHTTLINYEGERAILGTVTDITERKRAEETLQKYANDLEEMVSERTAELVNTTTFLNNILESSTEYAIVATDLKGTILNWNTGAKNIFGYDAQEVIGKLKMNTFYEKSLLRGKKRKNILEALVDAQNDKVNSSSPKLVKKNGESFPADITATYLKNVQGKAIGILAIIRDITERKMLERQLIQSEKLAGIGTLAAGIAHEVRNPLSIINTSSYLLREEIIGKTEVVEDLLGQIEDGIKRTQTIINNLLDFSRPAARELESVDLKNLMEKILSLEGRILSTQNIELRSELNNVPKITANLDSLKHVFLNLLINAVQSMPRGGTLGIKTYQEDNRVTVEISDTGIGIAKKDLPNIFDPFFTTKEPGKGTGLGLAFVHSEIERMGGTIRVASKQKLGSTFTVEFSPR